MGHIRLGEIPKTLKWKAVVATVANEESGLLHEQVADIAGKAIDAAHNGLSQAIQDPGLVTSFYVLTRVVLAARSDNWVDQLAEFGVELPAAPSTFDLVSGLQTAVEDEVYSRGRLSDVAEMSLSALGDALSVLVAPQAETLFGSGVDELQAAVRSCSTEAGFARLGQVFFGRFLARYLNFYLSRVTAAQVGGAALPNIGEVTVFNEALIRHCEQSAFIVQRYSGEWMSKTRYEQGITPENTAGFVAVAVKKLRAELKKQGAGA